ncbi:MAG: hypothetical protein OEP48_01220 [Betaproteobacteria bacterium]|nr:hypothetical protein [Betaproteobacteria bacterium]MDH3435681.1 hypothetical protein [Betaproteobacteria bacterium]
MSKRRARKPGGLSRPESAQPRQPSNPRLSAQTRKVLSKHYRTKYGVRSQGGR